MNKLISNSNPPTNNQSYPDENLSGLVERASNIKPQRINGLNNHDPTISKSSCFSSGTALLTLLFVLAINLSDKARAQYIITNPLEYLALAEGNEKINGLIAEDTETQLKTSTLQQTIATEFAMMRQWESKYNAYLKTAEGFASSVKAATTLYHDALWIFVSLKKLGSAIASNPSGAIATMSLNNLYAETFIELFTAFNLLKEAVAVGTKENMLNGAERSKMLWRLEQSVSALGKKLKLLYRSVKCYSLSTMWDYYTVGMSDRSNGEIATSAFRRWKRAAKSVK